MKKDCPERDRSQRQHKSSSRSLMSRQNSPSTSIAAVCHEETEDNCEYRSERQSNTRSRSRGQQFSCPRTKLEKGLYWLYPNSDSQIYNVEKNSGDNVKVNKLREWHENFEHANIDYILKTSQLNAV
ncbi:hypothetical protein TNIN_29421 [Trichonephila inaurata madagascariensis]|uniref:Uncharacterized protein n=1 Tax=Trichonephila inaurata madagascariensis TaxID=2747483 RepID=A0A8X6YIJ3_9ARAC|nr:hypothetical protein TNIN_29421 [Trichonephila inaurata madagascariensis]